jgi:hypothetical protein
MKPEERLYSFGCTLFLSYVNVRATSERVFYRTITNNASS